MLDSILSLVEFSPLETASIDLHVKYMKNETLRLPSSLCFFGESTVYARCICRRRAFVMQIAWEPTNELRCPSNTQSVQ